MCAKMLQLLADVAEYGKLMFVKCNYIKKT